MQQMMRRWKAWANAKRFRIYCFSQFRIVLSQIWKWLKTYVWHNFYILYRNRANNIPLKSYKKCETFSYWWFSLIPSRFEVISKTMRSFVLPLSRNRFFEMLRVKNLNFLACLLELHSVFHMLFLLVYL